MATDPISEIRSHIDEATQLPEPEPFAPSAQPLERLLELIDDARNGRDPSATTPANTNVASPQSTTSTTPAAQPGSLDALVGQQILATLESRALAGAARAEAIRRLAVAMQNPNQQNLQAVLDVLLSGDPNSGQSR